MTQPQGSDKDIALAELELHKTEFTSLRDELERLNQSEEQYLNFSLVTLAAVLATATFIIEQRVLSLFLLFALIFHVYLWEMLSTSKTADRISLYLVEQLIPRTNEILTGLEQKPVNVFAWEVEERVHSLRVSTWIEELIPNRRWIPILSVAGLIIAYIILTQQLHIEIPPGDFGLILFNLIVLIISAISNRRYVNNALLRSRQIQQQINQRYL